MLDESNAIAALAEKGITPDPGQRAAIAAVIALLAPLAAPPSRWRARKAGTAARRGVYCYGPPGRGKSMVVDTLFALAPCSKRRLHFHAFLREIRQRQMAAGSADGDALVVATRAWLAGTALLCFDEFHVHDIADAFLVGRFLDTVLAMGIAVLLTSNYAPHQLLDDPRCHDRFLPTIARIERDFQLVHFDGATDYRVAAGATGALNFFAPCEAAAGALRRIYDQHEPGTAPVPAAVDLAGRPLPARAAGRRLLWADFADLCVASRSHLDYLALAERWQGLIIDHLQVDALADAQALQRFIWLVDILYDQQRSLVIASDRPLLDSLRGRGGAHDLARLQSRLTELQSRQVTRRPCTQAPALPHGERPTGAACSMSRAAPGSTR